MSRSTVVIELAVDSAMARDLAAGGVFVPGCALAMSEECDLVVRGPLHQLRVAARVVYVDEQRGAGLELIGFCAEMKAQLAELAPDGALDIQVVDVPADEAPLGDLPISDDELALGEPLDPPPLIELQALDDADEDDLALPIEGGGEPSGWGRERLANRVTEPVTAQAGDLNSAGDLALAIAGQLDPDRPELAALTTARTLPPEGAGTYLPDELDLPVLAAGTEPAGDADLAPGADPADSTDAAEADRALRKIPRNVHERLRGLSLTAQLKVATGGELHERIVLERLYGKNVWETLLRNPRLTPPEVARIARYGALPRVLLDLVVANSAWLQAPEVRRALLSNARLGTDQILKVLRLLPRHELRIAAIQTAYPFAVRNAAKQLLRAGGPGER